MFGFWEALIVLLIVIVIFGANKLPQLGDALGRSIKNFRRAAAGKDEIDVTPKKQEIADGAAPAKDKEPASKG